jgi:DNA-binding NarL/FixJ family response regulator
VKSPRRADSDESAPPTKPKVLLVDDHPDILKSTSRLLSFDFDVVGLASDARQAVEAAQRLDPDLIALDITMPGRDGFQTAHDLVQIGSRARIVFLTMHESDDYVAEGFRSGGRGYVLKTRLHLDLTNALQRVLAGQMFLPSLGALFAIDHNVTGHVVMFHHDDRAFIDGVSGFISASLRRGDVVSLVTSSPIRAGVAERLRAHGWDAGEARGYGRYHASDAAESLASIMRKGRPDAERLRHFVAEIERTRVLGPREAESRLTVVGDMSAHLLAEGNSQAALELEHLWDNLTRTLPFLTICCYPMSPFDSLDGRLFPQLCGEHFAVAHAPEGGSRSSRL